MTRKSWSSLCLALCFCWQSFGHCSAYAISEGELTQLEQIFAGLRSNNERLLSDLSASKADLQGQRLLLEKYQQDLRALQEQLAVLQRESKEARSELGQAQSSLREANRFLQEYAIERKRTENRLRYQRNVWIGLGLVAILAAA